jgi:4-amino-4-deoxy-L-arabinose transferase-like glycosyltransferase
LTSSLKRVDIGFSAAVFLVALAASLAFIRWYPPPAPVYDAVEYQRIAHNLAAGKGFSLDGVHPYAQRPPLLPFLLGAWTWLAGASLFSAAVFQCLMHSLSAAAAYLLFRVVPCAPRWSFLLSLIVALQPMLLTRTAFILLEPTLLFFTTSALLATVLWLREKTAPWACAAGILWGFATLGKAVTLFVLPFAIVYRLAHGKERRGVAFRQAALFGLLFLAVPAPWTARNYIQFQRLIPVSDQTAGLVQEWYVSRATQAGSSTGASGGADLVERLVRNTKDFTSPARDWWWARGRYGPGEARPWYWTLHDIFHRFLYLVLLYRVFQTFRGKFPASRGFIALFCFLYWAEHSLILGIPRYALPVYAALLALLIPYRERALGGAAGEENLRLSWNS